LTIALYPGSFDPVTNGHLDVARRAAKLFARLIMGIYTTPNKPVMFSVEERVEMIKKAIGGMPNVDVISFSGLTVDCAQKIGAQLLVRGLRMGADFEYEFDLAMMNKRLAPNLEMVCLMASQEYQFVSSSLLKEAARLGADISAFVPPHVALALKEKIKNCK
jgi:pantetheine-phosphate adenylyltransferase